MASSTPLITGTDFITVSTRDFDRAVEFYGGVLGLPESKRWGKMPAAEFETGNLTLAVMQSDAFGIEFHANNHPIELHVEDFEGARAELESRAGAVLRAIADGTLRLRIDRSYPLREAAEAHRHIEGRGTTGKLLLDPRA